MRICLLTCSAPFLIDEKVFPPLGLMAVGTALRKQGHDVEITDTPDGNYSCFGLGPTTPEYGSALALLRQIRYRNPETRVVIGGPHAVANPEECLADGFDVVAIGDGENAGIGMFGCSGVVDLGQMPLDLYPIIDRRHADVSSYCYEIDGRRATTVVTSKGCPYQCGFCAKTENQVRYHPVNRIAEEVVYLRYVWGYNAIMIFDDTFILDAVRVRLICEILKRREMIWRCFVRGDLVVRHGQGLVDTMADSGCAEVAIGVESGSDKILKTIRKGENTSTLARAVGMLRGAGIRVKGLFIIGLPGEDQDSLAATQRFVSEVPLDDADFTVFQPYRGSPIWDNRDDYDIDWDDLAPGQRFYKGRSGEYNCAVRTSSLSQEDIAEARDDLERYFKHGSTD